MPLLLDTITLVSKAIDLNKLSEEELLETRICDLPIQIEGTWLADCIQQLYRELDARGIPFKPRCYLADEWATPEDEPVIGIPFFLAHPALIRLEKKMMLEAEGETREWCMKLLRHEAGHALSYAYLLHHRKGWRKVFGRPTEDYADTYRFRPYSKRFVRHLDYFYAQYHPDEDFVETFAVWLAPGLDWHKRYQGWPALRKLEFVDRLMLQIQGKLPANPKGTPCWKASALKSRLRNYYKKKRRSQAEDYPDFHDPNLKRIFAEKTEETERSASAAQIIRTHRKALLNTLSQWTGEHKYTASDLLKEITERCRALKLVAPEPEPTTLLKLSAYMTSLLMNYRYTGWFRGGKETQ